MSQVPNALCSIPDDHIQFVSVLSILAIISNNMFTFPALLSCLSHLISSAAEQLWMIETY